MINIACVLKTGGDFTWSDVDRLRNGIANHLSIPYRFVVLTDLLIEKSNDIIPLINDWPGWWSKLELFRPNIFIGPVIYFDLDTVIVGNIDEILMNDFSFIALQPWSVANQKKGNFLLWIMGWKNSLGKPQEIKYFQQEFSGIYSHKRHCRNRIPNDAVLICR